MGLNGISWEIVVRSGEWRISAALLHHFYPDVPSLFRF
jgi:hypothetical protein